MAFGDLSAFYLQHAGGAPLLPWGTNVRQLRDAPSAPADSDTEQSHPSNQDSTRIARPYEVSSTGSVPAFGWAIDPADLVPPAGSQRLIRAGAHRVVLYVAAPLVGQGSNCRLLLNVYRVASAAAPQPYERSLLGQAVDDFSSAGGETSISVNLPEVVFGPGESIQYTLRTRVNAGLLQSVYTLVLGTSGGLQGNVVSRIEIPGLIAVARTRGSASGGSAAAARGARVRGAKGAAAGASLASGRLSAIAAMRGSAAGTSLAAGRLSATAAMRGSAAGASLASGRGARVRGAVGRAVVGGEGGGATPGPRGVIILEGD